MLSVKLVLVILAAVSFGLAAFRVKAPVDFTPLGFCILTVALLLV